MAARYHSSTDTWVDDEVLQQRIIDRIESDAVFWAGQSRRRTKTVISVDVDDGYVTLSGIVHSASEKRRADLLARALGARGVDNRLQIASDSDDGP